MLIIVFSMSILEGHELYNFFASLFVVVAMQRHSCARFNVAYLFIFRLQGVALYFVIPLVILTSTFKMFSLMRDWQPGKVLLYK